MSPERIVIYGSGGSGKSSLAAEVATRLGLQHIEIDAFAFEDHYQHVSKDLLNAQLDEALSGGRWVIEGMHRLEIKERALPQAQLVVWLDVGALRIGARLLRRLFRSFVKRQTRHGRVVGLLHLFRELGWTVKTLRSHSRRRRYAQEMLSTAQRLSIPTTRLHPKDVSAWLASI